MRTATRLVACALFLIQLSTTALATTNGAYIGGQFGYAYSQQGKYISSILNKQIQKVFPSVSVSPLLTLNDVGPIANIFIGYQFNRYFAAEIGYLSLGAVKVGVDSQADLALMQRLGVNFSLDVSAGINVRSEVYNLLVKGMLPITDSFSLYGKLGIADIHYQGKVWLSLTSNVGNLAFSTQPSAYVLYPMFGIGMNYDLTSHVSTDLAWMRIQKIAPFQFPNVDLVAVGLVYHF